MTLKIKHILPLIAVCASAASGCTTNGSNPSALLTPPSATSQPPAATVTGSTTAPAASIPGTPAPLTPAQKNAVVDAVREMVADSAAEVYDLRPLAEPGKSGKQVCGYVRMRENEATRIYVELHEKNGVVKAQRGQVGITAANFAKVRFMCRDKS